MPMKKFILFFTLLSTFNISFAQDTPQWLNRVFQSADTLWLISHRDIPKSQNDQLLLNGRINPVIIGKQKTLSRKLVDSLIRILTAVNESDKVEESLCFDPHQAIAWVRDG